MSKTNKAYDLLDFIFYLLGLVAVLAVIYSFAITPQKILVVLSSWDRIFFAGIMVTVLKTMVELSVWLIEKMKGTKIFK